MDALFGIPMQTIMFVLLAVFAVSMLTMAWIFLSNRVMFKMGLRNLPRRGPADRSCRNRPDAGDADHHRLVHDGRHDRLLDQQRRLTTTAAERPQHQLPR